MIAVTGANGFVGRALIEQLRAEGVPVRAVVRQVTDPQEVGVGAIGPYTDWTAALDGVDCVIHCAAHVHQMGQAPQDAEEQYQQINTQGTAWLATEAARLGVRRLVFVSSVKVMGEASPPGAPWRISDPPHPEDPYGRSKWAAEQALWEVSSQSGLEVVIVRPPLVYGPGVKANFRSLMRWVQRGWPLPFGAIHNHRSLVALDNLISVLALCARAPRAAGQTFFVSDGHDLSTNELARAIARACGRQALLLPVPPAWLRLAGRMTGRSAAIDRLLGDLQVDIGHTIERLDWRPVLTVEQALRQVVEAPKA
jgi:nucleoside-diphosphate-sugar epimerase